MQRGIKPYYKVSDFFQAGAELKNLEKYQESQEMCKESHKMCQESWEKVSGKPGKCQEAKKKYQESQEKCQESVRIASKVSGKPG